MMPPALIIIDLQNDFIAPDGLFKKSHIPLGPILRPIYQLFHDQGWPIITIRSKYDRARLDNGDALEEVSNLTSTSAWKSSPAQFLPFWDMDQD